MLISFTDINITFYTLLFLSVLFVMRHEVCGKIIVFCVNCHIEYRIYCSYNMKCFTMSCQLTGRNNQFIYFCTENLQPLNDQLLRGVPCLPFSQSFHDNLALPIDLLHSWKKCMFFSAFWNLFVFSKNASK